jgi:tetratricopeptide (TPR) repeat protein
MQRARFLALAAAISAALASPRTPMLLAQAPPLVLPKQSPRASVSQTVGLTTISITYDRPAVNGREVWGKLVPFDSVWRAGANENTVISFSSPVTIGGQAVEAGRYGLHMIPTKSDWTVILSREASAWGSFSYDPSEDVLRFRATPVPGEMHERLAYTFDDPDEQGVVATLRWEKLALPMKIEVNSKAVVTDSLREQLRGLGRFFWQPWSQAAAWCAANGTNLEEATEWADRSIAINENFTNLRVKAALLGQRGDEAGAAAAAQRSLAVATEADINTYGYLLMGQGKVDSAIKVFRKNVKDHPKSWNTYDSLAEAYAAKGDKKQAIENYSKALAMTRDSAQKKRIEGTLASLRYPASPRGPPPSALVAQRVDVGRDRLHLIVGELGASLGRHRCGMLLRLGNAVGHRVDDEVVAAVAVEPLRVGEVRRDGGALGVLSVARRAGAARQLPVENAVALGDHLRRLRAARGRLRRALLLGRILPGRGLG